MASVTAGAAVRRGELAAALRSPAQGPHWLAFAPQALHESFAPRIPPQNRPNSPRRRAPSSRPATALALPAPDLSEPQQPHGWITRSMLILPGQTPAQNESGSPQLTFSGRAPPRNWSPAGERRRFPARVEPQLSDPRSTVQNRSSPSQPNPNTGQHLHSCTKALVLP